MSLSPPPKNYRSYRSRCASTSIYQKLPDFYLPTDNRYYCESASMWHDHEGDSHVFHKGGKRNAVEFDKSLGDFSAKRKQTALKLLHRPTLNYLQANTESLDKHISKRNAGNQAAHDSGAPFSPIKNRGRKGETAAAPSSRRQAFNDGKEVRSCYANALSTLLHGFF